MPAARERALRADRSRLIRGHYRLALAALVRLDRTDCFHPRIRERALREALQQFAAGSDPRTLEGVAVRVVLARTPQATMSLRRHPEFANL